MTYDPNIPQADVSPKNSASPMQVNFSQYQNIFSINHTPINNSNQGKHAGVVIKNQVADPGVIGAYDALYSKNYASQLSTQPQLFVQIPQFLPNQIPNTPMQITYNQVVNSGVTTPSATVPYQSFLIGGFLIFMNQTIITVATGTTITLSPTPSKILCVIAQPTEKVLAVTWASNIANNSQFQITINQNAGPATRLFQWIAICKA